MGLKLMESYDDQGLKNLSKLGVKMEILKKEI